MTVADQLLRDALQLAESERATVAARLIDSLDPPADDDVVPEWDAEIKRRLNELDRGAVTPIPWSEVRRTMLGLDAPPATPRTPAG